jgi:ribosomal protein S25
MGLVSKTAMDAVVKVLDHESWMPIHAIAERANCGKLRTVRSALTQLREEGRVVRGGSNYSTVYRLAAEDEEMAA